MRQHGRVSTAERWDRVYGERDPSTLSWFQPVPAMSLELIDLLGVEPGSALVDVGGGASVLATALVDRGYSDISVLDVSHAALARSQRQAGTAEAITWICEDVLTWRPHRGFGLWHDRAVFHFLTEPSDRDAYVATLARATQPAAAVIIATFAPRGPDNCSGMPVCRYSADELSAFLDAEFDIVATRRELHITPAGATQPFTWVAGRRRPR